MSVPMQKIPDRLVLIAGRGDYPLMLAEAARRSGVGHITAVAFRGETSRRICQVVDQVFWQSVGQLEALHNTLRGSGASQAVMAGQIAPKNLFTVRMDRGMVDLLKNLPVKNAHTIFGAIVDSIESCGVHLLPASSFMSEFMPKAGLLTSRAPDEREAADIGLGRRVVKDTSHLDIGQTVVVKDGVILAVEAFEGTDRAIRRGGKLGGRGAVVVKVPKRDHDMRFDIPVVGTRTLHSLKKSGISCLALEAGGCIILKQDLITEQADKAGIAITVLESEETSS
jgi:DUF1009 family protein